MSKTLGVVADSATTEPLFNLPEIPDSSLQVAIAEVLARHAKSYNTDRSGVGYVVCRCGLEMRLNDGANSGSEARTFAAHQAHELTLAHPTRTGTP